MKNFSIIRFLVRLVVYLHATAVLLWFFLNTIYGDRWGWLFLLNTGAIYLMLPVPLWIIRPFMTKHKTDIILATAIVAIGWLQFGHLLTPNIQMTQPDQPLTVMTTNLLGTNRNLAGIESSFLASGADVIGIQELSPAHAQLLQTNLLDVYPYQILDPQVGVTGMGIISRYPMVQRPLPWSDQSWVGTPQWVEVDTGNTLINVLNFHAIPPIGSPLPDPRAIKLREAQARQLVNFSQNSQHPVIILGDLNATDQSHAYAIINENLQDSWGKGGWGLGNSWPAHQINLFDITTLPSWLVRIDHIFVSNDWRVFNAEIGPWDGRADHRPVIVALTLED